MPRKLTVLLLSLGICLVAVSCNTAALPPLEGEPAELADEFIALLAKDDFEGCTGYFDAVMKRAMSARELEQVWEALVNRIGPYIGALDKREDAVDGYDVVLVTAEFEKDLLTIRIVFDQNRRVSGLWFDPVQAQ